MFSSALLVIRNDQGRNRKSQPTADPSRILGFLIMVFYRTSGLLATFRVHLSQRGGEELCTGVSRTC